METIVYVAIGFIIGSTVGYILGVHKGLAQLTTIGDYLFSKIKSRDAMACTRSCSNRRTGNQLLNGKLKAIKDKEHAKIHKRAHSVHIGSLENDMGFTKEEAAEAKLVEHDGVIYIKHPNHPVIKVSGGLEWVDTFPEQQVAQSNKEAADSVSELPRDWSPDGAPLPLSEPKIHPRYQEVKDAAERSIGVDTTESTE
jgi:hypothetical protein